MVTTCGTRHGLVVAVGDVLARGALDVTDAVLSTWPASMSAWVMRVGRGALDRLTGAERVERAGGQVIVTDGSMTVTPWRVTLPVLVTSNV